MFIPFFLLSVRCGVIDRIETFPHGPATAVIEIREDWFIDYEADPDWYEGQMVCFL